MPPLKPEHVGTVDLRDKGWRGTVSEVGTPKPPLEREVPDMRDQPRLQPSSPSRDPR